MKKDGPSFVIFILQATVSSIRFRAMKYVVLLGRRYDARRSNLSLQVRYMNSAVEQPRM